jgi:hypothetical protein
VFLDVLKGHVQSYVEANGMVTADGSNSKQSNSSAKDKCPVEQRRQPQQEQEMGEEKEEAKAEEEHQQQPCQYPRAGEAANPKANPLMHLFTIPSDNLQTLCQLHKELTRTIEKQNAEN